MLNAYLEWTRQMREALSLWGLYSLKGSFNEIVVAGMGGSGVVGDYLQVLSSAHGTIPVYVVKSHIVPGFISKRTLFVTISYSGDTIETLIAFRKALERGATIVTISSGGLLRREALKKGVLHIPLPGGLPPRASLPSMLYSLLGLLDSSGYTIVSREVASKSVEFLESELEKCIKKAEELSMWLYSQVISRNGLVVLAVHSPLEALGIRGKNEFSENSKVLVKVDVAPEWMHNDIVGYEGYTVGKLGVIEIVDPDDPIGYRLVKFMENTYSERGAHIFELKLQGSNMLEKLMYGSLILGLASVMLARKRGIDPVQTRSIELYKKSVHEIFSQATRLQD